MSMTVEQAICRVRCTEVIGDLRVLLTGTKNAGRVLADEIERCHRENLLLKKEIELQKTICRNQADNLIAFDAERNKEIERCHREIDELKTAANPFAGLSQYAEPKEVKP